MVFRGYVVSPWWGLRDGPRGVRSLQQYNDQAIVSGHHFGSTAGDNFAEKNVGLQRPFEALLLQLRPLVPPLMMIRLAPPLSCGILLFAVAPAVLPMGAQAHSTGIYKSEAEAKQRATELGCASVHQNNGRWMPCSDEAELHRMLRKQ